MKLDTVVVTAYSMAPRNTAYYENNKYIGIVLEIDKKTDIIVDASAMFMTETARNYFKKLTIGTNICEGVTELIEDIKTQYIAPSTQSVIVAIKTIQQRYLDYKLNDVKSDELS